MKPSPLPAPFDRSRRALLVLALAACAPSLVVSPNPLAGQGVEIILGSEKTRSGAPSSEAPGVDGIRAALRVLPDGRRELRALPSLTDAEVRAVQRALTAAGFDPGPYDGRMGPRVRAALAALQDASGLEPCGCLDGETLDALGLRVRVVQTVIGDRPAANVEILMPRRPTREPVAPAPAADPEPDTTALASVADPAPAPTGQRFLGVLLGTARRPARARAPVGAPIGRPFGGATSGRIVRGRPPGPGGNRHR